MRKVALAVFMLSLICFSAVIGCKKSETQPAQEQVQPETQQSQESAGEEEKK